MLGVRRRFSAEIFGVCVAIAVLIAVRMADASPSQSHVAEPQAATLIVYLPRSPLYAAPKQLNLLKPYRKQIENISMRDAMLSAVGNAALNVKWITGSVVGRYQQGPHGLEADVTQLRKIENDGGTDSLVLVNLFAQMTRNCDGLMVAASVDIAEKTLEGLVIVKHKELTVTISLQKAGTPLSKQERASIRSEGAAARARIWFANDTARLRTGMLVDLAELERQLRIVLANPT